MRIYISTPINARAENTFAEKYECAKKRVSEIIGQLKSKFPDAEFLSFSDVAPMGECTEAQAVGNCIKAVIESDYVIIDDSDLNAVNTSLGCELEKKAAYLYAKYGWNYLSELL